MTPATGRSRIAVLIPALDEEESLPDTLDAIPFFVSHVVVVDNGSTDRTAEVARSLGAEVVREPERGYGAACLAGVDHLAGLPEPPDVVVFLDADGSDDPAEISLVAEPVVSRRADLVLGVRRSAEGDIGALALHARFGSRLVLGIARELFGREFSDVPPFRAIRLDTLLSLELDDRSWGWTLQMQIRAAVAGLRIEEVEVTHRGRSKGASKIAGSLPTSLQAGAKLLYTLARERLRVE